jgi:LPS export ABC transporter protein LptC
MRVRAASVLTGVVAIVVIVALSSCRKATKPPVVGGPSFADSADQILFDVRSAMTETGVKRGDMFADTIFVFRDQSYFVMRRIRANFNTETGAPNGTLRGDRGTYDLRSQTLEGYGNVVVTSTTGDRLNSNHLKYHQPSNQISSDSAYRLVRADKVQTGVGFTTDPNLKVFKCKSSCGGSAPDVVQTLPRP